jgi:hypothetical protein
MSYTITRTAGTTLGTILDGTKNTSFTSLTLIGRNYANYGEYIANDFVKLVENFAYSSSPSNALAGQLWWNTSDKRLRVATADGGPWKIISSATTLSIISTPTGPTGPVQGDLWWETDYNQLYAYSGSVWVLVGPQRNGSGAIWEQISDGAVNHDVLSIKLDNVRTSIISNDSDFIPSPSIIGFATIKQGLTANSSVASGQFFVTANNANYLGNQPAASYLRNDIDSTTVGNLIIAKNGGLTIGLSSNLQITTTTAGGVSIKAIKNNQDIDFYANVSGTNTNLLNLDGATGRSTLISATLSAATTATSTTSGALIVGGGTGIAENLYVGGASYITGNLYAPTQSAGTADTTVATTAWVVNNSGFLTNKIYAGGSASVANTYIAVGDDGVGNAVVVIDGTTVATASASGFNLSSGATAVTQSDTYNGTGNAAVATTQFVKTASTWWGNSSHRSAKWVSTVEPSVGVNDIGSHDGDFWFQREA